MKRIAILGSTGSVGSSALAVAAAHADRLRVVGLAAGENSPRFVGQVRQFKPRTIAMATQGALDEVRHALRSNGGHVDAMGVGAAGLAAVATHPDVDLVLCASSGTAALEAVLSAIDAGKTIALANKEVLVMAGDLVMAAARRQRVRILPVDSEHNAIHQCLDGRSGGDVRRLILTASGGPFRRWPVASLHDATPADALRHPTWNMGAKITVDSSTLMNKGLEVIEAHWLFDVPAENIDVVIHPQSIVHSMVELRDGSVIAQLGVTDMQLPIQYAFSYPERWNAPVPALDLTGCGPLEFDRPDHARFPCLGLAYQALRAGGAVPAALNAANEVAVAAFLGGRLTFTKIPVVIERVLQIRGSMRDGAIHTIADVRAVDDWARDCSLSQVEQLQST